MPCIVDFLPSAGHFSNNESEPFHHLDFNGLQDFEFMSEAVEMNIVEKWLSSEASSTPESLLVPILKSATKSLVLDEGLVLNELRKLCEEPFTQSGKANVAS